jgi:hypothetical protein
MGRLSEMLQAKTGSFEASFIVAGVSLAVGALAVLILRKGEVPVKERRWGSFVDEFVLGCRSLTEGYEAQRTGQR